MAKGWGESFSDAFLASRELGIKKQLEEQENQQELAYRNWKMQQQGTENQMNMAKLGYAPSNIPIQDFNRAMQSQNAPKPFPGQYMNVGGTLYRQSPELMKAKQSTASNVVDNSYASAIADAIESGIQPPEMKGLYRYGGAVKGELAKRGFDLTKASRDWQATTKTIAGLNSTQQVRMRQALDSVEKSIPALTQLSEEFKRSGFKDVNWVTTNAALKGVGKQRDIATKYVGQINLMKDELAQGFMGGGVPSDKAFKLADDILNPMFGKEQFDSALKQLGYNLNIRKKAIEGITPLGLGGEINNPQITGIQPQNSGTEDMRSKYNALRSQGKSSAEAKKILGL